MPAKYGVAQVFRTKREAQRWANEQRGYGYGARVTKTASGYMVRRTDRPIK